MATTGAAYQKQDDGTIRSTIPARIDRMRWSPWHTRMCMALGTAWILDGLEITVAGSIGPILQSKETLGLSAGQVGLIASVYLAGQVIGALGFGRISDKLGRQKLFLITLGVYLGGNALTALTWDGGPTGLVFLYLTRFIAGAGIGGEYAAINSAIDEMMPARYRGRVDIAINGTYWAGAIIGTLGTFFLLNEMPINVGWRVGFLLGPVLGVAVWVLRKHLPESPRWALMNGHPELAEKSIESIEHHVESSGQKLALVSDDDAITVRPAPDAGFVALGRALFKTYPKRATLAATLMITQSFLYNSIFFTYTLVLSTFYGVDEKIVPLYLVGFALGNLIGPLVLGPLFDSWGRKIMISGTYLVSGVLLAVSAVLFDQGVLTAFTQTVAWGIIFFFASAGASAGYLTASELFPMEVRAKAIAVFFAIAQAFGATGPVIFGSLIGDGSDPTNLFIGYLIGAGVMLIGGVTAIFLAVPAEGKSLEEVTKPLSMV